MHHGKKEPEMKEAVVRKFYPTVEECKVNNLVRCTEDGCMQVFHSDSNLQLHVAKTHKKVSLNESCTKQYYCPETGCMYNTDRYFNRLKLLRQHYWKVHLEKVLSCHSCNKLFATENSLKSHSDYCGVDFKCCDCHLSYSCYETLKTHGRRKKHSVLAKSEYKPKMFTSASDTHVPQSSKNVMILPKNCVSLVIMVDPNKMFNQGSQTVDNKPKLKSKMTQVNRDMQASQTTQHTQTGMMNKHLTVETQTIGDFVAPEKNIDNSSIDMIYLKSSKTQTDLVESRNTSCNTSFDMDEFEFVEKAETISSSTQTYEESDNIYSISTTTHDSTHTDTSDLFTESMQINDFQFDNCHMETQTDFMFEEGMFDCDYMSNMYTQTCDDILNEFEFNNIETQTVFEDMLRSVESQTMKTHSRKSTVSCKDMTHMETQTDVEFRQMLEVINS
nr:unnamed protein product [Callosobruchus chinensis]